MSLARGEPKKLESEIQRFPNMELRGQRRGMVLLLYLCSLLHVCEAFTAPFASGWNSPRAEALSRVRKTWLSSTETEPPPSVADFGVSYSPHESLYMSALTAEAITMGTGDGAVDLCDDAVENNDDDDEDNEEGSNDDQPASDADDEQLKRRTAAAAAALLGRKRGSRGGARAVKPLKNTSVGKRRVGSATRDRASQSGTSKIMDAVRNVAAAGASTSSSETTNTTAKATGSQTNSTSNFNVGNNVIQATITSLLEGQNALKKSAFKKADQDSDTLSMNAFPRPFGILGGQPDPLSHELLRNPMPGTILLHPTIKTQEHRRPSRETLSVRVATPDDDLQIANLRLSVFSDFSSELRSQFCARSCQVLADRRLRGATCLVATCPSGRNSPSHIILGSVECSVHEFFATKLGRRRPKHSTLYITEVAVSPSARRCGVGSKLLQVRHYALASYSS